MDEDDKQQEGITDEVVEITLNIDQAIVLFKSVQLMLIDCRVQKKSLNDFKKYDKSISKEDLERVKENLRLISFIEDKIPYLESELKQAIVFLQKEDDSIIKGIQS